tara:strand:- start:145 stop:951 length:807 start_codon:yes stop_codon:yes gene_type:complete
MYKFIDCFIFNNELDLLEFRLNEHEPFTDYFILVESRKTFSGNQKKLYATENIERFKKWSDKLFIVVINNDEINNLHGFNLELYSRTCAINKVKNLYDNNIINENTLISAVSDVDEIYDFDMINDLKHNFLTPIRPLFYYHYYSIKITRPKDKYWTPQDRLKIVRYSDFTNYNIKDIEQIKNINKYDMGWHLCYFGNIELILSKLTDFSHSNMKSVKECINNPELIKHRISNNKDILGRENEKYIVSEPYKYPSNTYLLKNLKLDFLL